MKEKSGMRCAKLLCVAMLLAGCENQVQEIEQLAEATVRGSVGTNDLQANGESLNASISADGRYVAFESTATNLVPVGTNGKRQIYVRDRLTDTVEMVSLDNRGVAGTDDSFNPSISADGRHVAFESRAPLTIFPTAFRQIFVRDRTMGATEAITSSTSGNSTDASVASFSGGVYLAFRSGAADLGFTITGQQILAWARPTPTSPSSLSLVSRKSGSSSTSGNGHCDAPVISTDGRFVVFDSVASDLVAGDTNGFYDVYIWTRATSTLALISKASDGSQSNASSYTPAISDDGRFVVFDTTASNILGASTESLGQIVRRDLLNNTNQLVSVGLPGGPPGLYDRTCNKPAISGDGRFIAFEANLSTTENSNSLQIFLRDMTGGARMVSVNSFNKQGSFESTNPALSFDGKAIVWESKATNLVVNDTNGVSDIFLRFPLR